MVIVLDANILVSAFLAPKGEDANVLRQAREHDLYLSPFILGELWQTLHYARIRTRYDYTESKIEQYLKNLQHITRLIEPPIKVDACPDPKDNEILACAVSVEADYLITRNIKHFPERFEGIRVIDPRTFLNLVRQP